ncbi:stimulator of interferon genes [Paramuricea clavata]|uniref:Stimulator of interferon genes, partial n=1 Tax=Paramuricea clavata TaxID=317549 RepID=A0A7D9EUD2_PARCT|nr:stimulator of interferon genes [Paramuricea clavata]
MQLLHLNTQSQVRNSAILEEKEMSPGYILAWSYYYNYLTPALQKFKETISRPFPDQFKSVKLSLNKLLLLIPLDCYTTDNLEEADGNIEKIFDAGNEQAHFRFSVYRFKELHEPKYFAIQYVKQPLKTLREISKLENVKGVKKQNREEEVKLLYNTLIDILKEPPDQDITGMCEVIPMPISFESLQNGGLAKCLINKIQSLCDNQNDSGASTSENSLEMMNTANENQQIDEVQQVDHAPPNPIQSGQSIQDEQQEQEQEQQQQNDERPQRNNVQDAGYTSYCTTS